METATRWSATIFLASGRGVTRDGYTRPRALSINAVAGHFSPSARLGCLFTSISRTLWGAASRFLVRAAQTTSEALEYGPHERETGWRRRSVGAPGRRGLDAEGTHP